MRSVFCMLPDGILNAATPNVTTKNQSVTAQMMMNAHSEKYRHAGRRRLSARIASARCASLTGRTGGCEVSGVVMDDDGPFDNKDERARLPQGARAARFSLSS